MSPPLVRICVTGPECTGKTDLARRLAERLGTECVPEASRAYAMRVARPLLASDVEPIGRDHVDRAEAAEARTRARGGGVVMLDTDLVSTIVYARHYYGIAPPWVVRTERRRRADLYLLCDVDVPWIADGVRDRGEQREEMYALFAATLARFDAPVTRIGGDWEARFEHAVRAIESLQPA